MTMNKVEVEELLKVLEAICAEKYPDIPSELIKNIVQAQFENQDDRAQGYRDTKKLIDDFLKQVVAES
ncbi:MAG: DNA modification system-associated small protein [Desulfitobacteriaceae bacterium]